MKPISWRIENFNATKVNQICIQVIETKLVKLAHKKNMMSKLSVKNGMFKNVWLAVLLPKNDKVSTVSKNSPSDQDSQFEIKGVLIFWTFKSDHLEFLKTLPNRAKVDLYLLFLSKKILK